MPLPSPLPEPSTDILLIDDSLTDLRLLMDMLLTRQLRLSVAFNGQTGYQQAVLQQPQLILLDVHMPVLDGFAACRLLKGNPSTRAIPVIFLTAANDLAQRLEGFSLGGVDYIGKPFSEPEVLARIGVHRRFAPTPAGPGPAPTTTTLAPESLDATLVGAAQTVLRRALADPPSLDRLAGMLGTNRRRLNQAFAACCGLSVFEWLREECLRQAHYLVTSTDTPLAMIGDHMGYATPSHFAKAFRARFGCPPRSLRAEVRAAGTGATGHGDPHELTD